MLVVIDLWVPYPLCTYINVCMLWFLCPQRFLNICRNKRTIKETIIHYFSFTVIDYFSFPQLLCSCFKYSMITLGDKAVPTVPRVLNLVVATHKLHLHKATLDLSRQVSIRTEELFTFLSVSHPQNDFQRIQC